MSGTCIQTFCWHGVSYAPPRPQTALILAAGPAASENSIRAAIQCLHRERHFLYSRGNQVGYCLWSHTSVNLDAAFQQVAREQRTNPLHLLKQVYSGVGS